MPTITVTVAGEHTTLGYDQGTPAGPAPFDIGVIRPTVDNTGLGAFTPALTVHNGNLTITKAGTVVEDLDIHGLVFIKAANVTIRRCRVRGPASWKTSKFQGAMIDCNATACKNALIEWCDLVPDDPWFYKDGVVGHSYTARYNRVWHTVDYFGAFHKTGGVANVVIEGNYGHDLCYVADPTEPHSNHATHNDAVQIQGGKNFTIRGNDFDMRNSQTVGTPTKNPTNPLVGNGITVTPNTGPVTGVDIDRNWVSGGNRPIIAITNGKPSTLGRITGNILAGDNVKTFRDRKIYIQVADSFGCEISGNRLATGEAITPTLVPDDVG